MLTWKIWWAPNNASRWQMGFNSAFKGLKFQCKIHLITRLERPLRLQEFEAPTFSIQSAYESDKFVSPTHRPLYPPPRNILGIQFCSRLSHLQDHSAAGRNKSRKNPNDPIGNRTRDLPVCSAVPQRNAPPGTFTTMSSGWKPLSVLQAYLV